MEKTNTNIFRIPDNLENIDISTPYIPNEIVTISEEPICNNKSSIPNHNTELGLLVPEGTLIVLAAGTIYEEVCYVSAIDISSNTFPPTDQAAPNNTTLYIRARNFFESNDRMIYNCTQGSKLDVFPYKALHEFISD